MLSCVSISCVMCPSSNANEFAVLSGRHVRHYLLNPDQLQLKVRIALCLDPVFDGDPEIVGMIGSIEKGESYRLAVGLLEGPVALDEAGRLAHEFQELLLDLGPEVLKPTLSQLPQADQRVHGRPPLCVPDRFGLYIQCVRGAPTWPGRWEAIYRQFGDSLFVVRRASVVVGWRGLGTNHE